MLLSIILFPGLGSLLLLIFGRFIGISGACQIAKLTMVYTTLASLIAFYKVALCQNFTYVTLGTWISADLFIVNWGFMFDTLTVSMFVVVNLISTLVHIYSTSYMSEDPHIIRFLGYLSFFTFFMLILVSADNFIQLFLGWEGIGLCSYLLISFWFSRAQANKAAIKALLVNRVGDFGLSLGIFYIFTIVGSLDFSIVFSFNVILGNCPIILFFLFVGAIGKSAQIGLHTWLPDAMEGPTPVSALIHAATLVTAGVFLIIRCSPLFFYASSSISIIIVLIGSLTAFFAASVGLVQNDIKRVIAYSTCSQLGYMIFVCGLGNYAASFFHLANHAFFKALLFLAAGAVIHGLGNEQDMRRMGGLGKVLPFTFVMVLIGSLSLMGFPFFTGFYSKDFILEVAYASIDYFSLSDLSGDDLRSFVVMAYWLGTIAAMFTAFYSFRLIYLVFLSQANFYYTDTAKSTNVIHELPFIMAFPLIVLCFGSVFLGYLTKDMFIGLGTSFFNNSISISSKSVACGAEFFVPFRFKILPVIFSLVGCFSLLILKYLVWFLFWFDWFGINVWFSKTYSYLMFLSKIKDSLTTVYNFLLFKWYFDYIYNYYINHNIWKLSGQFLNLDKDYLEFFGPKLVSKKLSEFSKYSSGYFQGLIGVQAFYMVFGGFFLFILCYLFNFGNL